MRAPIKTAAAFVFVFACAAAAGANAAVDFRSIGERPAILYDAPSQKANKLFIAGRQQPVEVLVKLDKWSKVRDFSGEIAWIENQFLSDKRCVVVLADSAEVHTQPNDAAPLVFKVRKHVLLEPAGLPANGWVSVRHGDGQQGFIKTAQIWGG